MDFKEKLLEFFNLDEEKYALLTQDINSLKINVSSSFFDLNDAASFLKNAIKDNKKIMVYGDYDADGIMSTSIMVNTLKKLNAKFGYYIPSRVLDGYGITLNRAKQIKEKGYDILITVDNGVKQFEALSYLKNKGVKIILTDHHAYEDDLPPYDFFIHPFHKAIKEENCGAYVAFMFSIALLENIDEYLLSLASLATISDLMPLNNLNNRNIVRLGLAYVNNHQEHPFHFISKDNINEETFSFVVAPKINAYGRMKEDTSINQLIRLFIDSSFQDKYKIACNLESINRERKELMKNSLDESVIYNEEGIIAISDTLLIGLVGLLASRLQNEYNKPTIAFKRMDGILKGSARSLEGTSLIAFFNLNQDILLEYGGHELAGGISIKEENFLEFKNRFNDFIKEHPYIVEEDKYIEISDDDLTIENYSFLRSLSPFGQNFKEPEFLLRIETSRLTIFNNHIRANININASLIAFDMADKLNSRITTFIGKIKEDSYNKGKLSFRVSKII